MNKFDRFQDDIKNNYDEKVVINLSPSTSFRSRCEFSYGKNHYVMHDINEKIYIKTFKDASLDIQNLMPVLLKRINENNEVNHKLFQVNFRSNQHNKIMVTMIYHKIIDKSLINIVNQISDDLKVNIIIRSKNYKYETRGLYLDDTLIYKNLKIYQTDNTFTQSNKYLVDKMIFKVIDFIENPDDLLELYCGIGTFTIPLSFIFNKVLATENNRNSIKCLKKSLKENNISNIHNARLSSDEVSELFKGKFFNRMNSKSISDFNFSHILLDPPRSGLTEDVINLASNFKNIIYVSCSAETYIRDINLIRSHKITNIELFDQFPNKNHLEIVSVLKMIE
jgi:tRNA (uracil-5-)-methyltransferase|tara:strand:- start:56 stop:1066 length:1011 start_codon:yes stop_codon:yes gene_type:complete